MFSLIDEESLVEDIKATSLSKLIAFFIVAFGALGVAIFFSISAATADIEIKVVDGDTIHLNGEKIRILGLDTPETNNPECLAEGMLGERATLYLKRWIDEGSVVRKGLEKGKDPYGRTLAEIYVGDVNVAERLIEEGLATTYDGKQTDWCGET